MEILESAPALGFIGVVIGGLLTIIGQAVDRWAEREYQRRREAAELIATCLTFENSVSQLHEDRKTPLTADVINALNKHLTESSDEFYRRAVMSAISASSSVRLAATNLQVAVAQASKYLNLASEQGRNEKFIQKKYYLESMIVRRDSLTRVARARYFLRWPIAIYSAIQVIRFEKGKLK